MYNIVKQLRKKFITAYTAFRENMFLFAQLSDKPVVALFSAIVSVHTHLLLRDDNYIIPDCLRHL